MYYLSDRQQRVRLSGQHSSMKTIMKGVPQGSIFGPILFKIFMNDLSYAIDECTLFTYADDTQLFKSAEDIDQVEHAINADLKKVDEWYEFNQMKRNHSKYQAITFGRVERNPVLTFEGTVIPIQDEMELPGFTIDNKLKFEGQIRKTCHKVSQQVAVNFQSFEENIAFWIEDKYILCFHCTAFQLLLRVMVSLW